MGKKNWENYIKHGYKGLKNAFFGLLWFSTPCPSGEKINLEGGGSSKSTIYNIYPCLNMSWFPGSTCTTTRCRRTSLWERWWPRLTRPSLRCSGITYKNVLILTRDEEDPVLAWMNVLNNFKSFFCFHTFGVRRTIDVLDSFKNLPSFRGTEPRIRFLVKTGSSYLSM